LSSLHSDSCEAIPADEWQEIDTHTNEKYDEPAVSSKDGIVEGIPETAKNYDDLEDKTDQESFISIFL
jgi:hypothetical protein